MDPAITISSFEVAGNQKTQLSLFRNEFAKSCKASKFRELERDLNRATQRLQAMDIFSAMDVQVKILSEHEGHVNVGVLVNVKEKNVPALKAGTYFGSEGNNVSASVQGVLRNISGHGDSFRVSYGTNNVGLKDTQVVYAIPSVTKDLYSIDIMTRIYEDNSMSTYSSFHKNAMSTSLCVSSHDGKDKLTLQSVVRDEVPVSVCASRAAPLPSVSNQPSGLPSSTLSSAYDSPTFFGLLQGIRSVSKHTSPAVLALLSPSAKTSVTYSHVTDTRDSVTHPMKGAKFTSLLEFALPPGSAQFLRAEVALEKHHTVLSSKKHPKQAIVASLCGSFATTRVLDFSSWSSSSSLHHDDNEVRMNKKGERKLCHMSDRYFLGGPLSLRGVDRFGAGPRGSRFLNAEGNVAGGATTVGAGGGTGVAGVRNDVGDALGGLTKITALAALSSPLPFSYESCEHMRSILFLNGAVLLPNTTFPLAFPTLTHSTDILSYLRLSVGAGLSYSLGPARLELTCAVPLLTSGHDNQKSFQIGVAMGMNSS